MATVATLPKDISKLGQEIKLFGKWETQECALLRSHLRELISLTVNICDIVSKWKTSLWRITSKSAMLSTCHTPLDVMPRSNSRKRKCLLSNDWLTGAHCPPFAGSKYCTYHDSAVWWWRAATTARSSWLFASSHMPLRSSTSSPTRTPSKSVPSVTLNDSRLTKSFADSRWCYR